jgi:hypothetical protein
LRAGDRAAAAGYFRQAAKLDRRQLLRPDQIRKNFKAALSFLRRRG